MDTALVIPVYNRKEITLRFLDALFQDTLEAFTVIVVDSGSTDNTAAAVREKYPEVILLQTTPASWWAAATNIGVGEAVKRGCRHVITCNDDNIVTVSSLQQLVETAGHEPGALIAACICYYENKERVLFAGRSRSACTDRFLFIDNNRNYSEIRKEIRETDLLSGMCTLIPAQTFNDIGYFDETAFPHIFSDDDFMLRAKKAGYRLLVNTKIVIFNDHKETGLNPYARRLGILEFVKLLISRKSAFQVSTRSRFLWRHRRSVYSFIITFFSDYCRLMAVVIARWVLPYRYFNKLAGYYQGLAANRDYKVS